jgi:hypothetical protein
MFVTYLLAIGQRLRVQNALLMELATHPAVKRNVGRGTVLEPPIHSVMPRRLKPTEEMPQAWRLADPMTGSDYALRTIQTAAHRKRKTRVYSSRWWKRFGHRDCLSRYQKLVRELVSILPAGRIDMREEGVD